MAYFQVRAVSFREKISFLHPKVSPAGFDDSYFGVADHQMQQAATQSLPQTASGTTKIAELS